MVEEAPSTNEGSKLATGSAVPKITNIAAPDPNRPIMAVKIYAPFKEYFDGDAYSLSAVNDTGPFDILPRHRNFLCMLVPCTISLQTQYDEKPILIKVHKALMHVKANRVVVFVDV